MTRDFEDYVQRVYVYNWTGAGCQSRFDAGLPDTQGGLRPAYATFGARLAHVKP